MERVDNFKVSHELLFEFLRMNLLFDRSIFEVDILVYLILKFDQYIFCNWKLSVTVFNLKHQYLFKTNKKVSRFII